MERSDLLESIVGNMSPIHTTLLRTQVIPILENIFRENNVLVIKKDIKSNNEGKFQEGEVKYKLKEANSNTSFLMSASLSLLSETKVRVSVISNGQRKIFYNPTNEELNSIIEEYK